MSSSPSSACPPTAPAPAPHRRAAGLAAAAERCVRSAARLLSDSGDGRLAVAAKGRFDPVTDADTAVEGYLSEALRSAVPGSAVVGEEGGGRPRTSGVTWYVDPIDGTGNFLRGLPFACISVGAAVQGRLVAGCVYDVFRGECFTGGPGLPLRTGSESGTAARPPATEGAPTPLVLTDIPLPGRAGERELAFFADLLDRAEVRRVYSTALSLAWVAAGRADAACNLGVHPWDVAGGAALVRSAGGVYTPIGAAPESEAPKGEPQSPLPPELAPGFTATAAGSRSRAFGRWLTARVADLAEPEAEASGAPETAGD